MNKYNEQYCSSYSYKTIQNYWSVITLQCKTHKPVNIYTTDYTWQQATRLISANAL